MTGISDGALIETYPFRPDEILEGVHELVDREPPESELEALPARTAELRALRPPRGGG